MKKLPVFHPLLFVLFPILFLYSHNRGELLLNVLAAPAAVAISFTLIFYFSLVFILRDREKAGLLVSTFVVLFFSYGHFSNFFRLRASLSNLVIASDGMLLPLWLALFTVGAYYLVRVRADFRNATIVLNITALSLVLISAINIIPYEFDRRLAYNKMEAVEVSAKGDTNAGSTGKSSATYAPDIYYIILDRYASSSTLRQYFDYDNSEFINYLSSKEFFVATQSKANYPATHLSLASSLNMEYLDYLKDRLGEDSEDLTVLYEMLQDYKVWRFLKSKGYKFVHVGSWWSQTGSNQYADINYSNDNVLRLNEFYYKLLGTTALAPVIKANSDWDNLRKRTEYQFQRIAQAARIKGPKYVFSHVLIPHDPYVFGQNGEPLGESEVQEKSEKENYLNQLIYTNRKLKELIDKTLSRSKQPPIIILQADEGPRVFIQEEWEELSNKGLDYSHVSERALLSHMRIFNAYYLPGFNRELLYKSVTPVNTFRLIFNFYFGANYELLEDESYNVEDWVHPYKFVDITEKLSR